MKKDRQTRAIISSNAIKRIVLKDKLIIIEKDLKFNGSLKINSSQIGAIHKAKKR